MRRRGIIISAIIFIVFLIATLAFSNMPPGRPLLEFFGIPEKDSMLYGVPIIVLASAVFNGVFYSTITWLLFKFHRKLTWYKKYIVELMVYLIIITIVAYWHTETIFYFLIDKTFLDTLRSASTTMASIGVGLLGVMLVLPEISKMGSEIYDIVKEKFTLKVKNSTLSFLLSLLFVFLVYAIPSNARVVMMTLSVIATILFVNGLLRLIHTCVKIDELTRAIRDAQKRHIT